MTKQIVQIIVDSFCLATTQKHRGLTSLSELAADLTPKLEALIKQKQKEAARLAWVAGATADAHIVDEETYTKIKEDYLKQFDVNPAE